MSRSTQARADTKVRLLRSGGPIQGSAVIGFLGVVIMVVSGVFAHRTGAAVFSYVSALVLAAATARAQFFVGVRVEPDFILIRGVLRTRRVMWSELQGFSFGPIGIFPAAGIARLRDGRRFAITAIATAAVARRQARSNAEALIADLNRLLAEHG
jgi:hypothetical protein